MDALNVECCACHQRTGVFLILTACTSTQAVGRNFVRGELIALLDFLQQTWQPELWDESIQVLVLDFLQQTWRPELWDESIQVLVLRAALQHAWHVTRKFLARAVVLIFLDCL